MKHGVGVLFAPKSPCPDMGTFQIPVKPDANCDTLFQFDLAIAADSEATQHAFATISGLDLPRGRANVTVVQLPSPTATAADSTNGFFAAFSNGRGQIRQGFRQHLAQAVGSFERASHGQIGTHGG